MALPVLLTHFPPMADVPMHEAVVGLLRHWGDPRFVPPNVYELNLGLGNQLFYFLILPFAYVLPIGVATKLVVALALFFLPVAAARLADHLGVTRWSAVVIAPIALGWLFFWGLLANLIGLDLLLFALPQLDRFCERPASGRPRPGLLVIFLWIALLHFAHDLMALVAAGVLVLFTACSWRGWRAAAVQLLPAGLALALALSTRILALSHPTKEHARLAKYVWFGLGHKVETLPGALYAGQEWWIRDLIFLVCLAPMISFGVERWRNRTPLPATWKARAHHFRYEILAALLFLSYFAGPASMSGTTLVYHRFLAPAWILLTLTACTRARLESPWRLPRMLAALAPLAPLLTTWPPFVENGRLFADLDAAIAHMDTGSTYLVLELGPAAPTILPNEAVTGSGHIVAVLGGRGLSDMTRAEGAPVHQRLDEQWSDTFDRIGGHAYEMVPAYDLTRFRYAVLHTIDPEVAVVAVLALAPEGRVIFSQGEWTVLESTLPLVPIDSSEEPMPIPSGETLHQRCVEVAARIRAGGR